MQEAETADGSPIVLTEQRGGLVALNWICAVLISIVFLAAGLWKASDPIGAAVRLAQAKVPESLSVFAAVMFGIAETLAGVLLLIPRFRRWGSWLASLLLVAFIVFIGIHYKELVGAECSCFPWVKRAVGPQFFIGDGIMLLLAIGAGLWSPPPQNVRGASLVLAAVSVFTLVSYGVASTRHTGTPAPPSIASDTGGTISLQQGKVLVYFFNPHCIHCLDAGKKLAALDWGNTRFIGVPTESPASAQWFLQVSGLEGKATLSPDLDPLKKVFPFDLPPAAVAIDNGYEKAMLLQFEDQEPGATLRKLGFVK
jgi:uncharacterized membrane protein YphA (DoxX/SURF4 family)